MGNEHAHAVEPKDVQSSNKLKELSINSSMRYQNQSCTSLSPSLSTLTGSFDFENINNNDKLKEIENGVTGKIVPTKVARIAAIFWAKYIHPVDTKERVEIACAMYFGMMLSNSKLKRILKKQQKAMATDSIELSALKFLDMMGWLIRHMVSSDIDLYSLLQNLGKLHSSMNVNKIEYFEIMLSSMHETLQYYFADEYTVQVKYCMQQIFRVCSNIMCGIGTKNNHNKNQIWCGSLTNLDYLESMKTCLHSTEGREYMYHYLQSVCCDEIVVFYELLTKFKSQTNDKQRFVIAREMLKTCIDPNAPFAVNIDYDYRCDIIGEIKSLQNVFLCKDDDKLIVNVCLFDDVKRDIDKIVWQNHWKKFKRTMMDVNHTSQSSCDDSAF